MTRRARVLILAATLTTVAILTGGSSCATHTDAPDPAGGNIVDGTNAHVIRQPDGFRNVSFSCFGRDGVYVTSRGSFEDAYLSSGIAVVANDPNCTR